jgi:hypothetical protein
VPSGTAGQRDREHPVGIHEATAQLGPRYRPRDLADDRFALLGEDDRSGRFVVLVRAGERDGLLTGAAGKRQRAGRRTGRGERDADARAAGVQVADAAGVVGEDDRDRFIGPGEVGARAGAVAASACQQEA